MVLARNGTHGPVVHAMSAAAAALGISEGRRVVDIRAVHPDLHVEPADPEGDTEMLDRLAFWARRWCPWTVRDGTDGIVLDATGATHLFGGETALLADIRERFAMQGMAARPAMAPTRGTAQALARYGPPDTICDIADLSDRLSPLPVAALRLEPETVGLLGRLGLGTIGALSAMPRAALMRRFAAMAPDANPLILLDRATGRLADPLDAPPDPRRLVVRSCLAEPVMDPAPHLADLAARLCADLAGAGLGARHLRLTVYRIDGDWRSVDLATARATGDPAHIVRLLRGKTDRIDPGFGFDLLTLESVRSEPLGPVQADLGGGRDPDADVARLIDRLTARLGRDRVRRSGWRESHMPERVEVLVPAMTDGAAKPVKLPAAPHERPIRLLDRPEEVQVIYAVPEGPPARFRWRGVEHRTARHAGPERIAPEWWRDRPGTRVRDYYKVEVQDGRRFWLYREGIGGDGRGGAPRWFLHGFFA
ncbi:protein ImuB [Oceaniovalibus guishaninsula JLT2003]|uniref:Protein ImuB n=1 Tax=Oceaniovalibus guishaninsula JLT2003 TaxID=1231392 RepID=K2H9Z5_9RHOB|nr:protein ImuB [Oceaniovalibus guishaninsula JLT2003]